MSDFPANLQILANAGSGKTHTLITRIIRLLARGVHPRRIIALTFTRKAAGEFLSKLLRRLAAASLEPAEAEKLSREISLECDTTAFLNLLAEVVRELGKLQLTTLDSFFNRVVSAFPQELGLSGAPRLLDSHAEELAGAASLRHALGKLRQDEHRFLIQTLFERDEESIPGSASKELKTFRQDVHETFLEHPEAEAWGNPERIWKTSENPWKPLSTAHREENQKFVEQETGSPEFPPKLRVAWGQLCQLARGTKPNVVVKSILDDLPAWKEGTGHFSYSRKEYEVTPEAAKAAAALAEHYLYECGEHRLREARAVHRLLSLYEEEYGAEVRERGLLTFSDITNLLQPAPGFAGMAGEASMAGGLRLRVDERLDSLFDHWMLDEFQDTSRNQYRALENLLDEVISEAARGGDRSFFCVGDVKQAIYGWRKGDSRLFDELYGRYHRGGGLKREPLSISWRSAPEILSALNAVFGDLDRTAPSLPEEVRRRWQGAWSTHCPAPVNATLPGYFSWMICNGGNEEKGISVMQERVIELLRGMSSQLRNGLTIALLVRSGQEGEEWLETLRFAGIEALSEGTPPVGRDNPVAAAIRSALSLSVHPGDRFARNHLLMEPLRGIFFSEDDSEAELSDFILRSAERLAEGGFQSLMEWLLGKLAPLINDPFSNSRAEALRRAARSADEAGITDTDDFLVLLDDYKEQGRSAPSAVQILTVHKAKGLEYDMVVLPLSERQTALGSLGRMGIEPWRNAEGEPFVMQLPAEEFRQIPENATLAAAVEFKRRENAFEELCVWYVAMSRAKRALYLFSPEAKDVDGEKCPNFPQLLAAGLKAKEGSEADSENDSFKVSVTLGDPRWFESVRKNEVPSVSASPSDSETDALLSTPLLPARPASLAKTLPSAAAHTVLSGTQAFLENGATTLGSEVHALLETLEWLPWEIPPSSSPEAPELLAPCLANPSFRKLLERPSSPCTLWREQRFDLLIDGVWISGCFDRVVIHRNADGMATAADILDFKTDQGSREKLIATHSVQMESYRRALSKILSLPEEAIRIILIQIRAPEPVIVL